MRRKDKLVTGNYYHIFNRGVNKANIYFNEGDYSRFYKSAVHYLTKDTKYSHKDRELKKPDTGADKSLSKIKVLAYCLMPNHFHFLVKQLEDEGITRYFGRLGNAYSHYINVKYERVGPLFQGRFKNVRVESDEQLLHLSRYIHLNPIVSNLTSSLNSYKWSSCNIYVDNFQDELCDNDELLSFFKSKEDYKRFVLDQVQYAKKLESLKHLALDFEH